MMLLDANILLYALIPQFPQHVRCREWLQDHLRQARPLAVPWNTILAFLRIATHRRIVSPPLSMNQAWQGVTALLERRGVWIPQPGPRHREILQALLDVPVNGDLVMDAALAALANEHGLTVVSADSDFARFPSVRWLNPLLG